MLGSLGGRAEGAWRLEKRIHSSMSWHNRYENLGCTHANHHHGERSDHHRTKFLRSSIFLNVDRK